jgi:hypothetical protein
MEYLQEDDKVDLSLQDPGALMCIDILPVVIWRLPVVG